MDFIAYDLETTGTRPEEHAIIEIGAVRFEGGTPGEPFDRLVNPGVPIPLDAVDVHGITDDMVRDQPTIDEVLPELAEYCGDLPLVAHNAKFDYKFLHHAIQKHKIPAPGGVTIDTFNLAKRVLPGLPNYRLDTLVRHYGIPSSRFHRAGEDAAYCGMVFLRILHALESGGHPVDIPSLIELTGQPEMTFPKHSAAPKQLGLF